MPRRKRTATMDRRLAEHWRASDSDAVIADAMSLTISQVKSRACRMGLGVWDRNLKPQLIEDGKPNRGRRLRECMTRDCTTLFMSEGFGNRLCNRCNLEARYNRSQYD